MQSLVIPLVAGVQQVALLCRGASVPAALRGEAFWLKQTRGAGAAAAEQALASVSKLDGTGAGGATASALGELSRAGAEQMRVAAASLRRRLCGGAEGAEWLPRIEASAALVMLEGREGNPL